jgi:HEAT repeat protein
MLARVSQGVVLAALGAAIASSVCRADDPQLPPKPRCFEQLRAASEFDRASGVGCLSRYVGDDPKARRAVIEALRDRSVEVRAAAAFSLGAAGKVVIPELVKALGDDPRVVEGAVESLGQIGPDAIPALVASFHDHGMGVAYALAKIGSPALPNLIEALDDPKVRGPAVAGIERMGPAAAPAVPTLAALLKDPSPGMRSIALRALAAIGEGARGATPDLILVLDDPVQYVRVGAADTLAAIGPGAAAAVPKLSAMAQDANLDRQTRSNCALAVSKIKGSK